MKGGEEIKIWSDQWLKSDRWFAKQARKLGLKIGYTKLGNKEINDECNR